MGGALLGSPNTATLTINDVGSTFCSTDGPIAIPGTGTGASGGSASNPYPSNVVVTGLSGTTNTVKVKLDTITHTFGADIDILLAGPAERSLSSCRTPATRRP